jgi:hypothetical protein
MSRRLPAEADPLLARFSDDVQEIALRLRDRVLTVMPNVHEAVMDVGYTVSIVYGATPRQRDAIVYVASFSEHVNLGFPQGVSLPDPDDVLVGDGARMRHVKFRAVEDVDAAWIDRYLRDALAVNGVDADVGDGETIVRARDRRS